MTPFGDNDDGRPVHRLTISNGGLTAAFLTRGAILNDVRIDGIDRNLTIGSDDLADYFGPMIYHGALVGPVVNRIAGATAELDGQTLRFPPNEGENLLHSGTAGTWARVWEVTEHGPAHVLLRIDLDHLEGGFPGRRTITARFSVNDAGVLRLDLRAATDRPTFMNVANHSYWKLDDRPTWAEHALRIAADACLPVDAALIPTGEVRDVTGTGLDFRAARRPRLDDPLIDHCFVLSRGPVPLRDVLWFTGADGVSMTMATTEPGLQVYDGGQGARPGAVRHEAPAFEAQGWPDAMHHAGFPSVLLRPGQVYSTTTTWRFAR